MKLLSKFLKTYKVAKSAITLVMVLLFFCIQQSYSQNLKTKNDSIDYFKKLNKFEEYFIKANLLKNNADYDLALIELYNCSKLFPQSAVVYFEIAIIYFAQNKLPESKKQVLKAVKIDPKNVNYLKLLAKVNNALGDYKEQLKILQLIVQIEPKNIDNYMQISEVYYFQKQYDKAIEELEKIEKYFGLIEDVIFKKAECYTLMYNYTKTIFELEKLVKLYPNVSEYKFLLAQVYSAAQDNSKALALYNNLLTIPTFQIEARIKRVEIFQSLTMLDSLEHELKIIFESPYTEPKDKKQLYFLYISQAPKESSLYINRISFILKILENNPQDVVLHKIVIDYYWNNDDTKQLALPHVYSNVNFGETFDFDTYDKLVFLEKQNKNWDSIIKYSKQFVELNPYYEKFHVEICYAYFAKNSFKDVIEYSLLIQDQIIDLQSKNEILALAALSQYYLNNLNQSFQIIDDILSSTEISNFTFQIISYLKIATNLDCEKCNEFVKKNVFTNDFIGKSLQALVMLKTGEIDKSLSVINTIESNKCMYFELLGDIYFLQNNIELAKLNWKNAQDLGANIDFTRKELILQKK